MIYFIGNKEKNICKIGFSKRPYRRIETISKSFPFELEIFDIIEGDFSTEKMFHAKYDEFRLNGEWFHLDKVIELGIGVGLDTVRIEDFNCYVKNGYFYYPNIISYINKKRNFLSQNHLSMNGFLLSNKDFISSFLEKGINPIKNEKFVHPYIALELFRNGGVECKMMAYSNLNAFYPNQCVRVGVGQYKRLV